MALLGMAGTEKMELERCRGQIAKDFSRCATEFGLFPVGSGKPAEVFKWILIPLPMGDGWERHCVGLQPRTVALGAACPALALLPVGPALQGRRASLAKWKGSAYSFVCLCMYLFVFSLDMLFYFLL